MNVKVQFDLSRYSTKQIIDAVNIGALSIQEVKDSGVVSSFFGDALSIFINNREHQDLGKTDSNGDLNEY